MNPEVNSTIRSVLSPFVLRWDKFTFWLTFWMVFQVFLIAGQNVAFFLVVIFLYKYSIPLRLFSRSHWIRIIPWAFGIAAIISILNTPTGDYQRGFQVLPNYLYWQVLMLALIGASPFINYQTICKGCFWGIIYLIIYYQLFYFGSIPYVIIKLSHNTLAFIFICFTAPALAYCKYKYGLSRALILFLAVMYLMIVLERRSGTVFVFLTGVAALFLPHIKTRYLFASFVIAMLLTIVGSTNFFKNALQNTSHRLYELAYETEKTRTTDRSYLTRLLMLEKGKLILEEHLWTGVGLNNFTNYDVDFKGEFDGAKFVIRKKGMNETSAHNSYLSLIAEGGLLIFLPFIIIILFNVYHFIIGYNQHSDFQNSIYWSFIGAFFAMYFVTGITNVNTWFLIGLCTAISIDKRKYR